MHGMQDVHVVSSFNNQTLETMSGCPIQRSRSGKGDRMWDRAELLFGCPDSNEAMHYIVFKVTSEAWCVKHRRDECGEPRDLPAGKARAAGKDRRRYALGNYRTLPTLPTFPSGAAAVRLFSSLLLCVSGLRSLTHRTWPSLTRQSCLALDWLSSDPLCVPSLGMFVRTLTGTLLRAAHPTNVTKCTTRNAWIRTIENMHNSDCSASTNRLAAA